MGTRPAAVQKIFTQGDFMETKNNLDMAIEGKGFFLVDPDGVDTYTRDGAFKVDSNGNVVNCVVSSSSLRLPSRRTPPISRSINKASSPAWIRAGICSPPYRSRSITSSMRPVSAPSGIIHTWPHRLQVMRSRGYPGDTKFRYHCPGHARDVQCGCGGGDDRHDSGPACI